MFIRKMNRCWVVVSLMVVTSSPISAFQGAEPSSIWAKKNDDRSNYEDILRELDATYGSEESGAANEVATETSPAPKKHLVPSKTNEQSFLARYDKYIFLALLCGLWALVQSISRRTSDPSSDSVAT